MGLCADIREDFRAVFRGDPAARSALEVALSYAGFHAVVLYRVAHRILRWGVPLLPRLLSQLARFLTNVEIHPGARIAPGLFIDHGAGVVVGETTEIGRGCLLYQGVTLGGTGKETGKRHPTLGDHVVVGAGAKVLGAIRIGDYTKIGANSVVLRSTPPHSIVVGVPGKVIKKRVVRVGERGPMEILDHVHMPDPAEERFRRLEARIRQLEDRLEGRTDKGENMRIYNTLTGRKEPFTPLVPGRVGMYVCGVTVYDHCHIGHARSAVVFDVIRRYLEFKGFAVTYVKNFTDVDDKIIKRAAEEGRSWDEVARTYTEAYQEDMRRLGVRPPDVEPRATEHIDEIIEIIRGLVERGHAYAAGGDVFFSTSSFAGYGKLSKRDPADMLAGARVDVNEAKRDPMDFVLWKASKPGEPSWPSPWGEGRPGWHIECSAMSRKHLGESFDIHGGGADLTFPHHENEIAQSEAFSGAPFVRYWVHNGFITVDKEKMSKSLGNFFTIREILDRYDPEVVRFFILSTHYRSPIEFSEEQLRSAEVSLDRYYTTRARIEAFLAAPGRKVRDAAEAEALDGLLDRARDRFTAAMDDDFNTALAIGVLFEIVRDLNRYLDAKPSGAEARKRVSRAGETLSELAAVLGIFDRGPAEWNRSLLACRNPDLAPEEIERRIRLRSEARARKDWAEADRIRDELVDRGVLLEDRPDGTHWKVKV